MNSKETMKDNFKNLIKAFKNGEIDEIISPRKDWGGAHIIITADEEKVFLNKIDEDDFYSRKSGNLYVTTRNSDMLSGLFYYIKEEILSKPDNYLYAFMALSAIDFIKSNGDNDCTSLLEHVTCNTYEYLDFFGWESSMGDEIVAFEVMRNRLSERISDEDIKFML